MSPNNQEEVVPKTTRPPRRFKFIPHIYKSNTHVIRGWGRSVKILQDRGNTGDTQTVLADIHSFLLSLTPQPSGTNQPTMPLFLMGHSMGGGEVLTYILHPTSPYHTATTRPNLTGVLAYSPLIAVDPSTRPSGLTIAAGKLAARLFPRWQRYTPLDPALMSRDERVVADFAADELCHHVGTLEGLAGMLDMGLWLEQVGSDDYERAGRVPLWVGHGEMDRVVSFGATRRLARVLGGVANGDVVFCSYEGAFHKVHGELPDVKKRFVGDVLDWVLARCPPVSGQERTSVSVMDDEGDASRTVVQEIESKREGKAKL